METLTITNELEKNPIARKFERVVNLLSRIGNEYAIKTDDFDAALKAVQEAERLTALYLRARPNLWCEKCRAYHPHPHPLTEDAKCWLDDRDEAIGCGEVEPMTDVELMAAFAAEELSAFVREVEAEADRFERQGKSVYEDRYRIAADVMRRVLKERTEGRG